MNDYDDDEPPYPPVRAYLLGLMIFLFAALCLCRSCCAVEYGFSGASERIRKITYAAMPADAVKVHAKWNTPNVILICEVQGGNITMQGSPFGNINVYGEINKDGECAAWVFVSGSHIDVSINRTVHLTKDELKKILDYEINLALVFANSQR